MTYLTQPWKPRLLSLLQKQHLLTDKNSGLTLIEGLVAILIVSAVTTAITPMMFLSVATRIQNRRSEQALQLAHGQIDQIRVLMEQGINDQTVIDRQLPPLAGENNVNDVGPPYGNI